MSHLKVELVTKDKKLWSGDAISISAPAIDGQIGILRGHLPVLAVLETGIVKITTSAKEEVKIQVAGGFLSVDSDIVNVVTEQAEVLSN